MIDTDIAIDHDDSSIECFANPKILKTIDITFRIFYAIFQLSWLIYLEFTHSKRYSDSEQWILLLSIVIVLLGIQNCSIAFYPWVKNIRLIFYSTFIVLMIFVSVKDIKTLLFLEKKEWDPFYRLAEFFFYFVLLPNLTCLFLSILTVAIILLMISFMVVF